MFGKFVVMVGTEKARPWRWQPRPCGAQAWLSTQCPPPWLS